MNGKKQQRKQAAPKEACCACACQGFGPALTEFLRRLGPPEAARSHFESARVEMLKGLRALLDTRIQQVSRTQAKGERIAVD